MFKNLFSSSSQKTVDYDINCTVFWDSQETALYLNIVSPASFVHTRKGRETAFAWAMAGDCDEVIAEHINN